MANVNPRNSNAHNADDSVLPPGGVAVRILFDTLGVSALNPPGNLSEPYAFIAQWSWHVMLLASAMLVVGLPLVLRHLRRNGQRASLRFWIAFGSLCVSTGIQAYGEFVLFRPID